MTNYLIRRSIQMILVLFFASLVTYTLMALAPGGPWEELLAQQATGARQIDEEDIARIRASYELDLDQTWRFTRWLAGWPSGPINIGGQELLGDFVVGCYLPQQETNELGEQITVGCRQTVTLNDLEGRRVSRGVIFGDFGLSWSMLKDRPVMDVLWSRIPRTLQLMSIVTLLSLLIGIPLGLISAVRQYSIFDYSVTTISFIGSSMPTFFFGILLILIFAINFKGWGWFYLPPGDAVGSRNYVVPLLGTVQAKSFTDQFLRMIMPVSVLTMFSVAGWSRFIRSSMLEVLRQDYVRTARAKGLLENVVLTKHAFRNALIPFVTIVVFAIPGMFGGAIVTETVFNWPGMGRLFIDALSRSDYPVSMAIFLVSAFLTVIATLLGDVLYTFVDPRIRFS
jgi:peptide/nickel transport system permease protein